MKKSSPSERFVSSFLCVIESELWKLCPKMCNNYIKVLKNFILTRYASQKREEGRRELWKMMKHCRKTTMKTLAWVRWVNNSTTQQWRILPITTELRTNQTWPLTCFVTCFFTTFYNMCYSVKEAVPLMVTLVENYVNLFKEGGKVIA